MIKLGEKVTDSINGLSGVVTQRSERLHETPICWVEGWLANGLFFERWIVESRLEATDKKPLTAVTPLRSP